MLNLCQPNNCNMIEARYTISTAVGMPSQGCAVGKGVDAEGAEA